MALTRQLYKNQGGSNNTTNSWFAHQNARQEQETDRVLNERRLYQSRIGSEMQEFEAKAANKRHIREQVRIERERAIEEATIRVQIEKRLTTEVHIEDECLAMELERIKLDKVRNEKMRQHIRETNYELRELESKLRTAYIQKERTIQIVEKQAIKFNSYLEDAKIARHMCDETNKAEEDRRQHELVRQQEMIHYKQELEQQIEEHKLSKQKVNDEFLREKLVIDEIVRKIHEEDQHEIERKLERQRATREFIADFKRKREEWKAMERERMEQENRRIKEYIKTQEQRQEIVKANKHAHEQAFDRIQRALAEQIKRDREEREEQELVRQELYFEEQEQVLRKREQDEMEARIKRRLELQREHDKQIQFKYLRNIEIKQDEERFRQQLIEKFAEDDRIEQMNVQKRRMKQIEHKRAVDSLLEERRYKIAIERQREIDKRIDDERIEQIRKEIIEEERIKLLREHAHRLLGYLPKGVIRDEKDLDYLGNDFKNKFKRQQINIQHSDE